jgi:CheY-like chemotaxis protein
MKNLRGIKTQFMKILLIGDSQREQELFELALTRINASITFFSASACEQAFAQVSEKRIPEPDYIVLDTDTSDIDAHACLRSLKSSRTFGLTPIIVYSSSKETSDIKFLLDNGAVSHLYKSRSFTVFCQDLRQLLAIHEEHPTSSE